MERRTSFHNDDHLIKHIANIGRTSLSGIFSIHTQQDKRKFLFSSGQVIAVTSTNAQELPGSFLHREQVLHTKGYDIYLLKAMEANVRQWELALENISMDENTLQSWKNKHALFVIEQVINQKIEEVHFEPKQFPSTVPIVCSHLELLIRAALKVHSQDIYAIIPNLQNEETTITITESFPGNVENKTIQGLKTIITHHPILKEICENSLIEKQAIISYLFAFELLHWITVESANQHITKSFVASMSEENKLLREELINQYHYINEGNFYQLFSIDPLSDQKTIDQKYHSLKKKFQNIPSEELFSSTEDNIAQKTLAKIQEAYTVLSSPSKRKEYDQYIKSGKAKEFFQTSKSIADEKALDHFNQLRSEKKIRQAAQYGYEYMTKNPESIEFSIRFVELIVTNEFVKEQSYQKIAFDLLKYHIEKNDHRYEPFFLLGKLCMILKQDQNAAKSFQRALETRPDIPSLRNFIIDKSEDGPIIALEAIFEKLDTMNHYQLLAVDPKSSPREIHQSYRLCCRYFHPDRFFSQQTTSLGNKASEVFKKMAQAHKTLKNIQTREAYDISISPEEDLQKQFEKKQPPTHFKAREYFQNALHQIKDHNFKGALVNLGFALQFEPDNALIQEKIEYVKQAKKGH